VTKNPIEDLPARPTLVSARLLGTSVFFLHARFPSRFAQAHISCSVQVAGALDPAAFLLFSRFSKGPSPSFPLPPKHTSPVLVFPPLPACLSKFCFSAALGCPSKPCFFPTVLKVVPSPTSSRKPLCGFRRQSSSRVFHRFHVVYHTPPFPSMSSSPPLAPFARFRPMKVGWTFTPIPP